MSEFNEEQIAQICHEANRAYCNSIGDKSQVAWNKVPENIKKSAIDGVKFKLENPRKQPCKMHDNWVKFKLKDGWKYGEKKDAKLKTHPCIVPYEELPYEQQIKDHLFSSIVKCFYMNPK